MKWSYEQEWYEETNVARKIRDFLESKGWVILKFNEDKRQKGPDIIAMKNHKKLIVEVKGYPSRKYVKGEKKGELKPTHPSSQAAHWFAEALLSVVKEKSKDREVDIGIGLPKFPRYLKLMREVSILSALGLRFYVVDENGKVEIKQA